MSQNSRAYLANPIYAALSTTDAPFSLSHGVARRFQLDTIPFAGVPDLSGEALQNLSALLAPGEEIWITLEEDQPIPAVRDLEMVTALPSLQMRYDGDLLSQGEKAPTNSQTVAVFTSRSLLPAENCGVRTTATTANANDGNGKLPGCAIAPCQRAPPRRTAHSRDGHRPDGEAQEDED